MSDRIPVTGGEVSGVYELGERGWDDRSVEELQEQIMWDEDDALLPDEDDCEVADKQFGREW